MKEDDLEGRVYRRLDAAARRCPPYLFTDENGRQVKVIMSGPPHRCKFCGAPASSPAYCPSAGTDEVPGLLVCDAEDCLDKVGAMTAEDWAKMLTEGQEFWEWARGAKG